MEKIFPNRVDPDKGGYKWLNMEGANAAFVRALQELVEQDRTKDKKLAEWEEVNANLKAINIELKKDFAKLMKQLQGIESSLAIIQNRNVEKMARK